MKGTLIATGILVLFNSFCLLFYLPPMITEGMAFYIALFFAIAVAITVLGKVVSVIVLKKKQLQSDLPPLMGAPIWRNKTFLLSLLAASVLTTIVIIISPIFRSELIYYLLYYGIFVGFGVFLSDRCSARHTPLLFSLIVVIAVSITEFIVFINSPAAIGQFGPERVIFALRDFVGNTSIFFLAASVMWSSWAIMRSVKAVSNPAMQPTR